MTSTPSECEKANVKTLLKLKGYWRPCEELMEGSRPPRDCEMIVSVPISRARARVRDRLDNETDFEADGVYFLGASVSDKNGDDCYCYIKMSCSSRFNSANRNVQLALPVDVALIARQQIRRRLREWGKLLHFRQHALALCALVKELADAELKAADAAALRAEAARRERERLARERRLESFTVSNSSPGWQLGAIKELARLVLQRQRFTAHQQGSGTAALSIPFSYEPDASESILPPLREPVGLLDEGADQDKIALHK